MTTLVDELPRITPLLRRDLKAIGELLSPNDVRALVDMYYAIQDFRMQSANQMRASSEVGEPHAIIAWQFQQMEAIENGIKRVLDWHTDNEPTGMGTWAKSIVGIGPVLAAGLLAHIDVTHCPTAGHVWAFAGLDPTRTWGKGQKRPWNGRLKVLTWKIGESFVKVSGNSKDVYGHLYADRKEREQSKNDAGDYAEQAKLALERKNFGADTAAKKSYEQGKLPPAHVHARAKRWAVKLFLAHYWEEAYRRHYHQEPPLPYPIAILGHAHRI